MGSNCKSFGSWQVWGGVLCFWVFDRDWALCWLPPSCWAVTLWRHENHNHNLRGNTVVLICLLCCHLVNLHNSLNCLWCPFVPFVLSARHESQAQRVLRKASVSYPSNWPQSWIDNSGSNRDDLTCVVCSKHGYFPGHLSFPSSHCSKLLLNKKDILVSWMIWFGLVVAIDVFLYRGSGQSSNTPPGVVWGKVELNCFEGNAMCAVGTGTNNRTGNFCDKNKSTVGCRLWQPQKRTKKKNCSETVLESITWKLRIKRQARLVWIGHARWGKAQMRAWASRAGCGVILAKETMCPLGHWEQFEASTYPGAQKSYRPWVLNLERPLRYRVLPCCWVLGRWTEKSYKS